MAILLKRNAKVIISLVSSGWTVDDTTRLNILDNFSFSTQADPESVLRNTMGPSGDRGVTSFVQETSITDFSFTTYFSTFSGALQDELLWKGLTNKADVSGSIDFTESNVGTLPKMFVYFVFGGRTIRLDDAIITSAEVSMNQEGIPTVTWSGTAKAMDFSDTPDTFADEHANIPQTIGKFTTMVLGRDAVDYTIALTAFNVLLTNQINWVSRNRLGVQSAPEAHFLGGREVSGNLEAYIKTDATSMSVLASALMSDANNGDSDKFATMSINMGGDITITIPQVLFAVGAPNIQEALLWNVSFIANQTTTGAGDEISISLTP